MTARSIKVTHDGVTYDGQMATIKSTMLGVEDHGILTAYLHCEWPGGGIGVGGFGLDQPVNDAEGRFKGREGTAYGLDHIVQMMSTVGVGTWEKIPGHNIIVLFKDGAVGWGGTSVGIAHPTDEKKVFILKEHSDQWALRAAEADMGVTA